MMIFRRFFTLLLVVLMLANQGLCLAHAHHEHNGAAPEGHDSRPHFHLGGHVHHHGEHGHEHAHHEHGGHSHSHEPNVPPNSSEPAATSPCIGLPIGGHDSDAVYCGASETIARTGNSVKILADKNLVPATMLSLGRQSGGLPDVVPSCDRSSFLADAGCPIYLRALSLRL